jgi:hypothetical protein
VAAPAAIDLDDLVEHWTVLDDERTLVRDIHDRLMDAVEAGEHSRTPDLARLCATVLNIWPTLWNFTEHAGAEATNYSELGIRTTTVLSARSGTRSCGAGHPAEPRPTRATDSSNGSSRSVKPAASTTASRCTTTSSTSTPPA